MVGLSVDPGLSNLRDHILKLLLSLVAQLVKNPAIIQETAGNAGDLGSIPWRRKWQPTPIFLSGKSYGQRSMAGYSPWGCKELDMTEQLTVSSLSTFSQRDVGHS